VQYKEYKPSPLLETYVRCYYTIDSDDQAVFEDKAFATGCIEVMFTLHGSPWLTEREEGFVKAAPIELWGQILKPLSFKTSGSSNIFGIRFHPATAALLLRGEIHRFNDGVFDLVGVLGNSIIDLHAQLQDAGAIDQQVKLVDSYLIKRLSADPKTINRIGLVQKVMTELTHKDFFDNIDNLASRYGISSRYLQKVFLQQTGLTPKLYSKINRFQNSLILIGKGGQSLTDVAYACGYFDQSHFIREFRSFTGFSPSVLDTVNSTAILASPNK
jgi:AraC-like DNA-binding protein